MTQRGILIYGANGYTGELVARTARERGVLPVLGGRSAVPIETLGRELGLHSRIFPLEDPRAISRALDGIAVVIHCAGPFSRTSKPMADACLAAKTHYLDITGEAAVFESLAARDREARDAGVMLLPGAGFDVVPSDCLAAHLKRRLPSASSLVLAFHSAGAQLSRGTATTMLENLHRGGLVRKTGVLTPVPAAWKTRDVDFGHGPRRVATIPWGDVSTAYYSTGIPDIEVYAAMPASMILASRLTRPFKALFATTWVQSFLKRRILSGAPGPSAERRARAQSLFWGEVSDGSRSVASRQRTPEGYSLTALTAVAAAQKVLAGEAPPGFMTPSKAYGPDFVLEIPGVTREDL